VRPDQSGVTPDNWTGQTKQNEVITTTTTILWPFVRDYTGQPVPE